MEIIFTKHAFEKLRERGISQRAVISTIQTPQKLTSDSDKFYAFRKFGKKYLKVIFVRVENTIKVITQHYIDSP